MGNVGVTPLELFILMFYAVISIKASIYDIRFRLVQNKSYISLIFLSVSNIARIIIEDDKIEIINWLNNQIINFAIIMAVSILITTCAIVFNAMGGGDIKYIVCNMLLLVPGEGVYVLVLWFLLMFLGMLIFVAVKKAANRADELKKGIAMVPFISMAGILTLIITKFVI